jgi:GMP synthase-like glutamine amidotransferase
MADGAPPRILVIQHDPDKSLGRVADALLAEGAELDVRFPDHELPGVAGYDGIVVLPGLADPDDDVESLHRTRALLADAIARELPVLGICLGGQLVAQALGASTYRCASELGFHDVETTAAAASDALLAAAPPVFSTFHAHRFAFTLPEGAVPLLRNDVCTQAFRQGDRTWALQFHPESTIGWVDDLARTMRGEPGGVPENTARFFRSNGVDPEALERDARAAADTAHALATGIAVGFVRRCRA